MIIVFGLLALAVVTALYGYLWRRLVRDTTTVRHHVDLQLSGLTHGGRLRPGNLVAAAANPTVAGLDRYGDTQLYVSRGADAWGPPTRVGTPSDITVIELASRQA